jgi:hypothetical protein
LILSLITDEEQLKRAAGSQNRQSVQRVHTRNLSLLKERVAEDGTYSWPVVATISGVAAALQAASDQGVASVLLASVQAESDTLAARLAERDREVDELKQRYCLHTFKARNLVLHPSVPACRVQALLEDND